MTPEDPNPLVPGAFDLVWSGGILAIFLVALALWVIALVRISRQRAGLPGASAVLWVILVTVVPFAGAIAWFVAGDRRPRASTTGG